MKPAHKAARHRAARPVRTAEIVLAVGGVLAGFAVTLAAVTGFRADRHPAASTPRPIPRASTAAAVPTAGDDPSPAALAPSGAPTPTGPAAPTGPVPTGRRQSG